MRRLSPNGVALDESVSTGKPRRVDHRAQMFKLRGVPRGHSEAERQGQTRPSRAVKSVINCSRDALASLQAGGRQVFPVIVAAGGMHGMAWLARARTPTFGSSSGQENVCLNGRRSSHVERVTALARVCKLRGVGFIQSRVRFRVSPPHGLKARDMKWTKCESMRRRREVGHGRQYSEACCNLVEKALVSGLDARRGQARCSVPFAHLRLAPNVCITWRITVCVNSLQKYVNGFVNMEISSCVFRA